MHRRAFVVAGQQCVKLPGIRAERVGEGLRDPPRMGMHQGGVTDRVAVDGRGELLDPGLFVAPGDGTQHAVDETCSCRIEFDARLLHGSGHRGVLFDPRAQQLVGAQPQQIQQHRVDVLGRPTRGRADDRVEQAAGAAGAVGQLGGERRVAAGDSAFAQERGQSEVGIGVSLRDRTQHVERRLAGGVKRFAPLASRLGHFARTASSRRAPRAQSAAFIGFLPGGWI